MYACLPGSGGAVRTRPLASRQLLELELFLLQVNKQLSPHIGQLQEGTGTGNRKKVAGGLETEKMLQ